MTSPASEPQQQQTVPAPEEEPTGTGESDPTLHQLSEKVDRLAEAVSQFVSGHSSQAEPEPPDIKAEVRSAVREVQNADKAKAAKNEEARTLQERIKQLEHKVEKAPQEFKRATERMGWTRP